MTTTTRLAVLLPLALFAGCSSNGGGPDSIADAQDDRPTDSPADDVPPPDTGLDVPVETDADAGADADAEADADAGADAEEDGETTGDGTSPSCEFDRASFVTHCALGGPGFDLDADGTPDNALGGNPAFTALSNPRFRSSLESGELCLLFEHDGLETPAASAAYDLRLLDCTDPDGTWADWSAGTGVFRVLESSLEGPACSRLAERTMRTDPVTAGALVASGDPVIGFPGFAVDMTLHDVHLEATLVSLPGGIGMTTVRVGGHVVRDEYRAALEAYVAGGGSLPIEIDLLLSMLGPPDVDDDGDGTMDSWSVGYEIEATSAQVDGTAAG